MDQYKKNGQISVNWKGTDTIAIYPIAGLPAGKMKNKISLLRSIMLAAWKKHHIKNQKRNIQCKS